jgi:aspartyl-tRNA(Asn)/glutamyl-tRNA(Gln) amidotransferase subunit A
VADAALMLNVITRPDPRDPYQAPPLNIDYGGGLDDGVKGMRIAYSPTLGYAKVDREVAALVERGVQRFSELGAQVESIDLQLEDPIAIMQPLWQVAMATGVAPMTAEQRALCDQPMLAIADAGMRLSALEYRQAERQREAFARRMIALHERYDLLVTPQLATTAFAVNHEVPPNTDMKRWWQWSPFTYAFNLTQQPAATMPCGFASNGLPVAMQLVGTRFADALVMRAARAYEKAYPIVTPKLGADGTVQR